MERRERKPKADCPGCGHWDSLVVGGRYDELNQVYVRYRRCQQCWERFETEERVKRRGLRPVHHNPHAGAGGSVG